MTFIWPWPKIPFLVLKKSIWSWLLSLIFMTFDFYLKSFLVDGDKLTFTLSVSPCLVDLYWPVWPWVLFFVCTGPELSDGAVPDPPTVRDLPDLRRDPAVVREHPGDCDLPTTVPDQPGGGHSARGGLLPDRGPQGLQGRSMSLLPWWCTLIIFWELLLLQLTCSLWWIKDTVPLLNVKQHLSVIFPEFYSINDFQY